MSLFSWIKSLFVKKKPIVIDDFEQAMAFVFKWEGGETYDTGGHTKYGISQRAYPRLDIKNLTRQAAISIYRRDYWEKARCHQMMWPLNLVIFDSAVNLGVRRATSFKKEIEDTPSVKEFCLRYIARRDNYYKVLARRSKYKKYLRGWLNRTSDLRKNIEVFHA